MISCWNNIVRRFPRNTEGSAMLLVGLGGMMLIAATGVAIDMGRVQVVQSRLSNALDAAGLAAGNAINSGTPSTIVNNYFYANFPAGYMGATINQPTVVVSQDNSLLTLDVSGTVPTTFMRVFNIDNIPVAAHSEITRSSMGLELVLVIDNTGSMTSSAGSGVSKIDAAKDAATDLINILFGNNSTVPNLWAGIVPFSQAVNIGSSRGSWTGNTAFTWGPTSWMGCVESRAAGGQDVTDEPPSVALFPKYYSPCNSDTDGNGPDNDTNAWFGTNSNSSNGNPSWGNCQTGGNMQYKTPLSTSRGPNKNCPQPLTPLTAQKSTIINAINSMQAAGSTAIPLGMAWSWRLLSPKWQNLWGGEMNTAGLPLAYNTPLMNKVVVMLTDGDNDISWDTYTAYGYPTSNQLGANACSLTNTSNCTAGEGVLNTRTAQICASMKAQGIIIYTIGLGTSLSQNSQNLLLNCATSPSYYFYSPSTSTLQGVFQQIGDSLANLRISQ